MEKVVRIVCVAAVFGLLLNALPVAAQGSTSGLIRGTVVDPQGEIEGLYSWPEPRQFEELKDKIREYLQDEDS